MLSLSSPPFFFFDSNTLKKMHGDKWQCGGQWWLRTTIALGCLAFWVAGFCGCFDLEAVVVVLWFWRLILGHGFGGCGLKRGRRDRDREEERKNNK